MGRGARRAGMLAGLALTAVAAATPPAHAAQITHDRDSGVLTYTAAPGEVNQVAVSYDAASGEYAVSDQGATEVSFSVLSGSRSGCRAAPRGAICTGSRLSAVEATLGDRDDRLTADTDRALRVNGGAGDDLIETSRGDDSLDGGPGADRLACGAGLDIVIADAGDLVDASCDQDGGATVDNPPPPADPTSDATGPAVPVGPDGSPVPAPDLVLPVRPVTLGAPGIVQVQVGCATGASAACSGDIYVEAPARAFVRRGARAEAARGRHSLRQRRLRHRRLGHRRFRVDQGRTVTTPVPVLRGHYVMRDRRKRVRGRVRVVQRDATGKVLGTTSRPVVLERKWSRRGKQRRRR